MSLTVTSSPFSWDRGVPNVHWEVYRGFLAHGAVLGLHSRGEIEQTRSGAERDAGSIMQSMHDHLGAMLDVLLDLDDPARGKELARRVYL